MTARTIAIGDIHGCDVALNILLDELAPRPEDFVICVGDVIDRGPNTRGCIDRLLQLRDQCRFMHLMGNHEEMFLDAISGGEWSDSWPQYGGREMLASYGGSVEEIPPEHLDFIKSGKDYYESDSIIFAHAAINPAWPMDRQTAHYLRWNRLTGHEAPHVSGKPVLCGHTAQRDARPLIFPGWVCLDTCAYSLRGALSALVLEDQTIYQATQWGKFCGVVPAAEFLVAPGGG
ncbi:MAG: metallophosphoesterase [Planctomycetaceae bacterium]